MDDKWDVECWPPVKSEIREGRCWCFGGSAGGAAGAGSRRCGSGSLSVI